MIRTQRRTHARIFFALAPLLAAALVWALVQRERATRLLRMPATTTTSQPESSP